MRVNFVSPNPVPVKAALAEMGLIEDVLRQPLLPLAEPGRAPSAGGPRRTWSSWRRGARARRGRVSERRRTVEPGTALQRARRGRAAAWAAPPPAAPTPSSWRAAQAVVGEVLDRLELGRVRAAWPGPDGARWLARGGLGEGRPSCWPSGCPDMTEVRDGPILAGRDRIGPRHHRPARGRRRPARPRRPARRGASCPAARASAAVPTWLQAWPSCPPAFVNTGAWVGEGTMIDSHVLVGSCAQVGRDVHLAAGRPGRRRPRAARRAPGHRRGGCLRGRRRAASTRASSVGRGAVIGAGVILTGQSRLVDLVEERELRGTPDAPLVVPPRRRRRARAPGPAAIGLGARRGASPLTCPGHRQVPRRGHRRPGWRWRTRCGERRLADVHWRPASRSARRSPAMTREALLCASTAARSTSTTLAVIRARAARLRAVLPAGAEVAFAVKANPSPRVLRALRRRGARRGRRFRGRAAGCPAGRLRTPRPSCFTGPGKTDAELEAALRGRHPRR